MLIATTRGMVIHDGKLLCVQQNGHAFWCLPGGKVDEGESIVAAFKREMIEELGIEPKVGALMYVHQFSHHDGRDFIEFFFKVDNPEDYFEIDLSKTTHGEAELDAVSWIEPEHESMLPDFLVAEAHDYLHTDYKEVRYRYEP